jgi:cobalamin biosynthesis Co2+ chelatase CbiK
LAPGADYGALLAFIATWLNMNSYARLGEPILYFSLNLVAYLVSLLQTNIPIHYQMKVYVVLAPSSACPQRMKANYLQAVIHQAGFDNCLL